MSDVSEDTAPPRRLGRRGGLLLALIVAFMGAGGFVATYVVGLNLPFLQKNRSAEVHPGEAVFYDVPQLIISLPGSKARTLMLTVKIEASSEQIERIDQLLPRILDAFNVFLSDISPVAFERRGILEIIRYEMATRLSYVLGPDGFSDLLITEFVVR